MALHVELVSPERILYSGEAEMVVARTVDGGEIAFLTGHAPFLGTLGIGTVRIHPVGGGPEVRAAVHGGFVEVRDDKVSILSDVAELGEHVDAERARRALAAAEEGLRGTPDDPDLTAAYRRAQIRIETALAA